MNGKRLQAISLPSTPPDLDEIRDGLLDAVGKRRQSCERSCGRCLLSRIRRDVKNRPAGTGRKSGCQQGPSPEVLGIDPVRSCSSIAVFRPGRSAPGSAEESWRIGFQLQPGSCSTLVMKRHRRHALRVADRAHILTIRSQLGRPSATLSSIVADSGVGLGTRRTRGAYFRGTFFTDESRGMGNGTWRSARSIIEAPSWSNCGRTRISHWRHLFRVRKLPSASLGSQTL